MKIVKKILLGIGIVLVTLIVVFVGFIIFSTATTLKVKDIESMEISGESEEVLTLNNNIKLLTWNIGYSALDEEMDFYLDGGVNSLGESEEKVIENMNSIMSQISSVNPNIFFIQEIDVKSKRSYRVNELSSFIERFSNYESSYACNFKAGFIPIPIYSPMGIVEGGITTFSRYHLSSSDRIQLPIPFSWPVSLLNLKRCLLVNRISISGSNKELVLINLHLEAYDDGEGKAKQLKQLMDIMEEELNKGNYVIAGGDFNQTFSEDFLIKYPKMNDWVCPIIDTSEYSNFSFLMDDTHPTCRSLNKPYYNSDKATHQYYMLDGFIVSNNVEIVSYETINLDFKNTDHNPVLLNFILR